MIAYYDVYIAYMIRLHFASNAALLGKFTHLIPMMLDDEIPILYTPLLAPCCASPVLPSPENDPINLYISRQ